MSRRLLGVRPHCLLTKRLNPACEYPSATATSLIDAGPRRLNRLHAISKRAPCLRVRKVLPDPLQAASTVCLSTPTALEVTRRLA